MVFTVQQQHALAIIPRAMGTLSMLGSGCVITAVIVEMYADAAVTYHRLLLGMSTIDFLTSFWFALSTRAIPKGTPGVWAPLGNVASCTTQGFFTQLSIAVPLYNASLAMYYLFAGRYGWTEESLHVIEPVMHGIPVLVAVATSVAGIFLNVYNSADLWCWIASPMTDCDNFTDATMCSGESGENEVLYRFFFSFLPLWMSIVLATACMIAVYWTVLQQERDIDKFQHDGQSVRTQSKRVGLQAAWFLIAFYVAWVPSSVGRTMQASNGGVSFGVLLSMSICRPLQGFLNFIVFFRARYLRVRRYAPGATNLAVMANAALSVNRAIANDNGPVDMDTKSAEEPGEMKGFENSVDMHGSLDFGEYDEPTHSGCI